jgi:hypothetical protein
LRFGKLVQIPFLPADLAFHYHDLAPISVEPCDVWPVVSQEERSVLREIKVSAILSKKLYTYICPIPKGFRDRAISLYSSKIVDEKEILRTVSSTGIYCSSGKVGTVYLV